MLYKNKSVAILAVAVLFMLMLCSCSEAPKDFVSMEGIVAYTDEPFMKIYDQSIGEKKQWYINDHCIIRDKNDKWHMFGITHEEPANPKDELNFAHAVGDSLTEGMWKKEPFAMTADFEKYGEVHLWAPYIVYNDGIYYMYYCAGGVKNYEYQINIATSDDLYNWERYENNPIIVDGFDARDPMVFKDGDEWILYYTATSSPKYGNRVVKSYTSSDLLNWEESVTVFTDPSEGSLGGNCESPFVIKYRGYYFLFIGPRNGYSSTEVFVSDDPQSFDISNKVGEIEAHAPEVIELNGELYITRCGWGQGGLYITKLNIVQMDNK